MSQVKALVLFSGGLDSILAARTLLEQNIKVTALCFESNFYDAKKAKESAKELGIDLRVVDIRERMLDLVKNPPNGYGKNMNPCIDCHSMMFELAVEIMRKDSFDILASGEVLGQRPFSQNKDALLKIQNLVGIDILRPLSAKLLPETSYEKEMLVNRGRLHRISGRTREGQGELIKKYNIKKYPSPAGGCLLTDPDFSSRIMDLLDNWPESNIKDVEILKNGRVFWFDCGEAKKALAIVGRNHEENEKLKSLSHSGDIILELKDINGPTSLLRGLNLKIEKDLKILTPKIFREIEMSVFDKNSIIKTLANITAFYAVKARGKEVFVHIKSI